MTKHASVVGGGREQCLARQNYGTKARGDLVHCSNHAKPPRVGLHVWDGTHTGFIFGVGSRKSQNAYTRQLGIEIDDGRTLMGAGEERCHGVAPVLRLALVGEHIEVAAVRREELQCGRGGPQAGRPPQMDFGTMGGTIFFRQSRTKQN